LQNQDGLILFLSGESFHGPLTINLHYGLNFEDCFSMGDEVQILVDRLIFPQCQIAFTHKTLIWSPPSIKFPKSGLSQAIQSGIDLAEIILEEYKDGLFFPLLNVLYKASLKLERDYPKILLDYFSIDADLSNQMVNLLGLGQGLTPAGDDFLCGFLLAGYTLEQVFPAAQRLINLTNRILAEAPKKTTALSAALLVCAARGEADERLLMVLDWLAGDISTLEDTKEALLSYGHSSGMDALPGMLAGIILQHYELQ
jgi:hypothetical protein